MLYAFAQLYSWKSDLQDQVSALRMPVLNGIAVARRIRETGTNVVVVFLTAWVDLDMLHPAGEAGSFGLCASDKPPSFWFT